MVNSPAASPTTNSGSTAAPAPKPASLSQVQGLLNFIQGLPAAALVGVVFMFFAWSCERQAHQREADEAKQVKKQDDAQISQLQQQAAGAVRDALQNTQAARNLEAQRQGFVLDAERLRQSLESLRNEALARTNEVATLPTSVVASRVAALLQQQVSGPGSQASGLTLLDPPTQPAPAVGTAGAVHPLLRGGEAQHDSRAEKQNSPAAGAEPPAPAASGPALTLSDDEARKVDTAFVELDSCRQQAQVMGQQVSVCEQQAKLDTALEQQQADAITKLNTALTDKNQILARSEEEHRAELKAARGTWRTRFFHAVEIFAGGFIAGVLVR